MNKIEEFRKKHQPFSDEFATKEAVDANNEFADDLDQLEQSIIEEQKEKGDRRVANVIKTVNQALRASQQ